MVRDEEEGTSSTKKDVPDKYLSLSTWEASIVTGKQ